MFEAAASSAEPRGAGYTHSPGATEMQSTTPARRLWAINGDFVLYSTDGVLRYATEVTKALDTLVAEQHPLARGVDLTLLVPEPVVTPDLKRIATEVVPEFRSPRLPQVWCQLQLPRRVRGGLISFCNLAPIAVRKQIVCIHDLQTRLQPKSYGRVFRWAHRVILPIVGRRSFAVTTVSEGSARDIECFGVAEREKITVTWNGADHAAGWQPSKAKLRFLRPYIFGYVRPQAHKNAELFWKIAPALNALGIDLVLSGSISEAERVSFGPTPENLHLTGRLSDDEVAAALRSAVAFLLPSRAEGFGLPLVEAMVWGCPVVASSIESLRSVAAGAAILADPESPQLWIEAVERLAGTPEVRERQRALGRRRAEDFTWRRIAERYLELMARADGLAPA